MAKVIVSETLHEESGAQVHTIHIKAAQPEPSPDWRVGKMDAIEVSGADIADMVNGYLDAQLWAQVDYYRSSCDCHADGDRDMCHSPMLDENYGRDDIVPDYVDSVRAEFEEFVTAHPLAVRMYLTQRAYNAWEGSASAHFGLDFYLTREHHGAGFWDRGLGELGDYLTKLAHEYGSADELSDDGNGTLVSE